MNRLLAILGPTCTGKSQLGIRLAQIFNGEIVSADSRQVYRYMNIGTGKPTPEELSLVPHHLIDIVDPDDSFSLAQYQSLAYRSIEDIQKRNKLPILVGGSGLYVWSVLEGWIIPTVPPDMELRRSLEEKAARLGADELFEQLVALDPSAAYKIDPRNVRRVIRALEVHKKANEQFSRLQKKRSPSYNTLIIGLTADRLELYHRNDQRVDDMIRRGLVAEIESLLKKGYDIQLPSMSSLGYKQIALFLKGQLALDEAVKKMKIEIHRFIRHQYAWFRLKDDRIKWFDIKGEILPEVEAMLRSWLEQNKISIIEGE